MHMGPTPVTSAWFFGIVAALCAITYAGSRVLVRLRWSRWRTVGLAAVFLAAGFLAHPVHPLEKAVLLGCLPLAPVLCRLLYELECGTRSAISSAGAPTPGVRSS